MSLLLLFSSSPPNGWGGCPNWRNWVNPDDPLANPDDPQQYCAGGASIVVYSLYDSVGVVDALLVVGYTLSSDGVGGGDNLSLNPAIIAETDSSSGNEYLQGGEAVNADTGGYGDKQTGTQTSAQDSIYGIDYDISIGPTEVSDYSYGSDGQLVEGIIVGSDSGSGGDSQEGTSTELSDTSLETDTLASVGTSTVYDVYDFSYLTDSQVIKGEVVGNDSAAGGDYQYVPTILKTSDSGGYGDSQGGTQATIYDTGALGDKFGVLFIDEASARAIAKAASQELLNLADTGSANSAYKAAVLEVLRIVDNGRANLAAKGIANVQNVSSSFVIAVDTLMGKGFITVTASNAQNPNQPVWDPDQLNIHGGEGTGNPQLAWTEPSLTWGPPDQPGAWGLQISIGNYYAVFTSNNTSPKFVILVDPQT